MKIHQMIVRGIVLVLFASSMALTLGCEDEQEENFDCETQAVSKYAASLPECDQDLTDCMNDCSDTDIDDCLWDCEDESFSCYMNYNLSLAGCSCLRKSSECVLNCNDFDDLGCMIDCSNLYLDCAGSDTPSVCAMNCESNRFSCDYDCQDESSDIDAYLTCRDECSSELLDCLPDCS